MNDKNSKLSGFGIGEVGKSPASTAIDDIEANRIQPVPMKKLVKCDCGHTVPASWVMNASLGTSCPNCFDDMSG